MAMNLFCRLREIIFSTLESFSSQTPSSRAGDSLISSMKDNICYRFFRHSKSAWQTNACRIICKFWMNEKFNGKNIFASLKRKTHFNPWICNVINQKAHSRVQKKKPKKIKIVTLEKGIEFPSGGSRMKGLKIWIFIGFEFIILLQSILNVIPDETRRRINELMKISIGKKSKPHRRTWVRIDERWRVFIRFH